MQLFIDDGLILNTTNPAKPTVTSADMTNIMMGVRSLGVNIVVVSRVSKEELPDRVYGLKHNRIRYHKHCATLGSLPVWLLVRHHAEDAIFISDQYQDCVEVAEHCESIEVVLFGQHPEEHPDIHKIEKWGELFVKIKNRVDEDS